MIRFRSLGKEDLRGDLFTSYNALLDVRKHIGYLVEDPKRSSSAIESEADAKALDERYRVLNNSTLRRMNIRKRIVNLFKRDGDDELVMLDLIKDIKNLKKEYSRRTSARQTYGLLAPLAFRPEDKLSEIMGEERTSDAFVATWLLQFQQLGTLERDLGLLDVTGITLSQLEQWWGEGHPDRGQEKSHVWSDIQALTLRLVCVLDMSRIHSENDQIEKIATRIKKLALAIIRLVYLRPERLNDIRSLFELLVPVTYSLSLFLHPSEHASGTRLQLHIIQFFEAYLNMMESSLEETVISLRAENELNEYRDDMKTFEKRAIEKFHFVQDSACVTDQLRRSATIELMKLGLKEVQITAPALEDKFAFGSFSWVYKCRTKDGSTFLAAKALKEKGGDVRTQERLLREARRWADLSHRHINPLFGFAVDPYEPLPYLLSPLCDINLEDFLKKNCGKLNNGDRLRYLKEIAEALVYCHDRSLAHGDLRPANVLLVLGNFDSEMIVKLIDFGVSYIEDSEEPTTTMQHTHSAHLAPELMPKRGSKGLRLVSMKGDVYSFGCCFLRVLYDVTTEEMPVSALKKRDKHDDKGPQLDEVDNGKHIEIRHWKFLKKVWKDNPKDRPSASELLSSMLEFLL